MELGSWYVILGVILILISLGERIILYKVLVGQARWLPEKASKLANIAAGITALAGVIVIVANAVLARH